MTTLLTDADEDLAGTKVGVELMLELSGLFPAVACEAVVVEAVVVGWAVALEPWLARAGAEGTAVEPA